jgi:ABC-type Fe3+-hydroxamate transport system substrate-binding protein
MSGRTLLALLLGTLLASGVALWWASQPAAPRSGTGLVSLHPSITDTLVALGAAEDLVGRSDYCTNPAIQQAPALGTSLTPNLEAIAAAGPAKVLVEGSGGARTDLIAPLAPLEVLPWLTAEEAARSIRRLGALTAREPQAEALARDFEERLTTPPPDGAPRVLLVLSMERGGPVWFLKRNSLHGAALHAAGLRNAVDEDIATTPTLSLEALIALDPDVIVFLVPSDAPETAVEATRTAFADLTPLGAPRRGQVHALRGDWLGTGPEILAFVDALAALPIAP